eukprot:COSAG01_NODE_1483_length_10158_cov_38.218290_17_plen_132_part_00
MHRNTEDQGGAANGIAASGVDAGDVGAAELLLKRGSADDGGGGDGVVTRVDLELPNHGECQRQGAFAFVLTNVLSRRECLTLIAASEQRGYGVALINAGRNRQVLDTETRNSARNIFDCRCVHSAQPCRLS